MTIMFDQWRSEETRTRDARDDSEAEGYPGGASNVALHEQLFRYAEELQDLLDKHFRLKTRYYALREAHEMVGGTRDALSALIGHTHDLYFATRADGTIMHANGKAVALAANAGMDAALVGTNLLDLIFPDDREEFVRIFARVAGFPTGVECALRLVGGGEVLARVLPVFRDGKLLEAHWLLRTAALTKGGGFDGEIASMVFQNVAEGVVITDERANVVAVNPSFTRITGYEAHEVVGRNPRLWQSGRHHADFYEEMWRELGETGTWQGRIYNQRKNGEVFPEWLAISAGRDDQGKTVCYIGVFSDVSRIEKAEARLSYLAYHDALTGLPNRVLFEDRLAQAIAQARRNGPTVSLMFIDLDRFKQVNDAGGHAVGDRVLQEVASRLRATVRSSDTVGRLAGDEFVVLAPGLNRAEDIEQVADKLIAALQEPIEVEGRLYNVGCSIGCARYPDDGADSTALLRRADIAMYRAKKAGGGRVEMQQPLDAEGGQGT